MKATDETPRGVAVDIHVPGHNVVLNDTVDKSVVVGLLRKSMPDIVQDTVEKAVQDSEEWLVRNMFPEKNSKRFQLQRQARLLWYSKKFLKLNRIIKFTCDWVPAFRDSVNTAACQGQYSAVFCPGWIHQLRLEDDVDGDLLGYVLSKTFSAQECNLRASISDEGIWITWKPLRNNHEIVHPLARMTLSARKRILMQEFGLQLTFKQFSENVLKALVDGLTEWSYSLPVTFVPQTDMVQKMVLDWVADYLTLKNNVGIKFNVKFIPHSRCVRVSFSKMNRVF